MNSALAIAERFADTHVSVAPLRALRPVAVNLVMVALLLLGRTFAPQVRMSELSVLNASHATAPDPFSLPCWTCTPREEHHVCAASSRCEGQPQHAGSCKSYQRPAAPRKVDKRVCSC